MIDYNKLITETIDFEGRFHDEMYITISECKLIMSALESQIYNKSVGEPGTFIPSEFKIPKEPRPINANNKSGKPVTWRQK